MTMPPPPGWYPDPGGPALRYWGGERWADHPARGGGTAIVGRRAVDHAGTSTAADQYEGDVDHCSLLATGVLAVPISPGALLYLANPPLQSVGRGREFDG